MANQRVIEAILKFRIEQQTVSQTQQDLEKIKTKMGSLVKHADYLRRSIADAIKHKEPFDYLQRWLDETEQEIEETARTAKIMGDALEKSLKQAGQQADQAKQRMQQLAEASEKFSSVSVGIAAAGTAIAGPFVLAANSYIQSAGKSEATSRRWLAATDDLARSQMRIGRVAAQTIVPVLEQVADLAEKAAEFAEKHPDAVKAALGVGGALVGVGALGAALGKGVKMYADARTLLGYAQQTLAGKLMNQAADKQLAAAGVMGKAGLGKFGAGLGLAGSVVGGLALGVGVNEAFAGSRFDFGKIGESVAAAIAGPIGLAIQASGIRGNSTELGFESLSKYATVGAYGLGSLFGQETASEWGKAVADLTGALDDLDQSAQDTEQSVNSLDNALNKGQILDSFIAFTKESERAERDYEKNRAEIVKQFGEQRVELERSYEQQRATAVAQFEKQQAADAADFAEQQADEKQDFLKEEARIEADYQRNRKKLIEDAIKANQQAEARYKRDVQKFLEEAKETEAKAEKEYYDRRKKAAEQYNRAVQQAEEAHQKQMRRAYQDHNQRLEDAVRNQDAIAFIQEQRSYEQQRKRAEEDYQDQAGQQSEEFARQMKEMEEEFEAQREARAEEREKRLQEMQENYELEKAERDQQTQERLAEMDAEFQREKEQRLADFQERQAEAAAEFAERQAKEKEQHEARLAEMDAQHAEQMKKLDEQEQEQLDQLKEHYDEEKAAREEAFKDQLNLLDETLLGEQEIRNKYYELMEKDLEAWLERQRAAINGSSGGSTEPSPNNTDQSPTRSGSPPIPSTSPGPRTRRGGRAGGGYAVGQGLYEMAEQGREFVLSNKTTRSMEGILGGSLTQDALLAALASGRSGGSAGGSANLTQQFYISSDVDIDRVLSEAKRQAEGLIQETIRGY